jgi:hypothetical protein
MPHAGYWWRWSRVGLDEASRLRADSEWIRQRHVENKFGEYCGGITAGANMMSLNTKVWSTTS